MFIDAIQDQLFPFNRKLIKGTRTQMKIFFGAAIQGADNREERAAAHRQIIDAIKSCDCEVMSEHTTGKDFNATAELL